MNKYKRDRSIKRLYVTNKTTGEASACPDNDAVQTSISHIATTLDITRMDAVTSLLKGGVITAGSFIYEYREEVPTDPQLSKAHHE